jgi:copper homeostasis protein
MLLEVCAYNIQSCIIAQKAGAGRIELCADPTAGGVTPSWGLIQYALESIEIPLFPMIRPRGGNFVYDADELSIMKKDILMCRDLGCKGIAVGIQLSSGLMDVENMKRVVEWAGEMEVTCHKAFDRTPNAEDALEAIIAAGCKRVLTSGLAKTAIDGVDILQQLMQHSADRIIIMPGGGVRSTNIAELATRIKSAEYHSSGIIQKSDIPTADLGEVQGIVNALAEI